ncbi:TetR/AcrR family transcriptional regulator [Gluconacetobacter takamatsuzukensis]|uniref:TetR/AcrR family transcriptional regulator n=1 Tax=Gluconacetobacter takamatsuzukensis TaxID=1286190 RepID=A0A7W4PU17_9PROT|nr:TetR/AcrR family transcriptional regulator [Gluconacetobacter takamatsuzukensis]MBB2206576.1 TetR/AcrR family transcriptional regulator [Gluconacetobacter takamatsuzukensis]
MKTEDQILTAAAGLLEEGGVAALTTRAVCQVAGVTAPTLYHHFGDKEGLLRAVLAQGVAAFMAQKRANRQTADALADLKRGWDGWIAFALERPNLFRLMIESTRSDPGTSQEAFVLMRATVERLGHDGRLTTDVDTAALAVWAAANGVLTLFMQGTPVADIRSANVVLFDALMAGLVRPKDAGETGSD